jgi:glycosyltransferase involved in cell wall biosynthesis
MPTYNAEPYLGEALDSILAQTYPHFELIAVDDGSTDRTPSILADYAERDDRIRICSMEHGGPCAALNRGLEIAETEWVAIMHADDVMEPHRLQRQVAFIEEHPNVAVISSLVYVINGEGKRIGLSTTELTQPGKAQQMVQENEVIGFHHPAAMLRKSVARDVGGYRQEFWPCEDIDLWNRIAEQGEEILVQPEYLLNYRKHGGAASSNIRLLRNKYHYTKAAMICRRRGDPEPTYDEFLERSKEKAFWKRLVKTCKDEGYVRYKKAVLYYANGAYGAFLLNIAAAVALRPAHVLEKVRSKYFREEGSD